MQKMIDNAVKKAVSATEKKFGERLAKVGKSLRAEIKSRDKRNAETDRKLNALWYPLVLRESMNNLAQLAFRCAKSDLKAYGIIVNSIDELIRKGYWPALDVYLTESQLKCADQLIWLCNKTAHPSHFTQEDLKKAMQFQSLLTEEQRSFGRTAPKLIADLAKIQKQEFAPERKHELFNERPSRPPPKWPPAGLPATVQARFFSTTPIIRFAQSALTMARRFKVKF